eukprot:4002353-Amphidinium_carterae.2
MSIACTSRNSKADLKSALALSGLDATVLRTCIALTLRPLRRSPACTISRLATTSDNCHSPLSSVHVRPSRFTIRSVFSRTTIAGPPGTSLAQTVQWFSASSRPKLLENSHVRCT